MHARRKFFELADIAAQARQGKAAPAISPIALEAVKRIDTLFDIERTINGASAEERLRIRQEQSASLLAELEAWLREERARLSRSASVIKPIDYLLKRWDGFARFLKDGWICLSTDAVEKPFLMWAQIFSACPAKRRPSSRKPARRARHSPFPFGGSP